MSLHPDTRLGTISLLVADLERVSDFYQAGAGLERLEARDDGVVLGSRGAPLLELVHRPDLPPAPRGSAGLYHTAVLFSQQADLAAALYATATAFPESFTGSADHLVSLAFYFNDPEGNGVELYWDRPREEWRWQDGSVAMDSLPLDPNRFISEHRGGAGAGAGEGAGTGGDAGPGAGAGALTAPVGADATIGHVHLKVGDIPTARAFYIDALGFDVTVGSWPSALFTSAGGYHHHVGMNVWESRGAGPRSPSLGLQRFEVLLPDDESLEAVAERLARAGAAVTRHEAGIVARDPWGTEVALSRRGQKSRLAP